MVPGGGLEPPHPCGLQILSLLRLPISPSGRKAGLAYDGERFRNAVPRIKQKRPPSLGTVCVWRPRRESNPSKRICNPVHNQSATRPVTGRKHIACADQMPVPHLVQKNKTPRTGFCLTVPILLERRIWSGKRDSNSRPRPWQGRALPTELFPQRKRHFRDLNETVNTFV